MNLDDLLQRYLDGDLPPEAVDDLEERLTAEPELAQRLDRLADLRVQLGGLDDIEPPAGLEERLAERLHAERTTVVSLDAHRRARARWGQVGLVAAAVVAVALVGGRLLDVGSGGGAQRVAQEELAGDSAAADLAQSEAYALESGALSSGADVPAPGPAPAPAAGEVADADDAARAGVVPQVRDARAVVAGEQSLRDRYAADYATALATGVETTQESAAEDDGEGEADEQAPPEEPAAATAPGGAADRRVLEDTLSYGAPASCLERVVADDPAAQILLAETLRFDGTESFAFVVAREEARQVVVVSAEGCKTLAAIEL